MPGAAELLDRRARSPKALDFIDQCAGAALLPLLRALRAARSRLPGASGDEGSSQPSRPGGRRTANEADARQARVGAGALPDGDEQAEQHRRRPQVAARVAAGGRPRPSARSWTSSSERRRRTDEHARHLHRRQRLLVGRALPPAEACPYEECMRVPLVVRYPPLAPRAARRDALRRSTSTSRSPSPSSRAWCPPIPQDGRSMARLLADTEAVWRTDFLYEQWARRRRRGQRRRPRRSPAVRSEQCKYVEYVDQRDGALRSGRRSVRAAEPDEQSRLRGREEPDGRAAAAAPAGLASTGGRRFVSPRLARPSPRPRPRRPDAETAAVRRRRPRFGRSSSGR